MRGFPSHASVHWEVQCGPTSLQGIKCKPKECKGCKNSWGNSQKELRKQPASTETPVLLKLVGKYHRRGKFQENKKKRELDRMVARLVRENSKCLHKSCSGQRPPPSFGERGPGSPGQGIKATKPGVISVLGLKQATHRADSCLLGGLVLCKNDLEDVRAHFNHLLKNTSEIFRRIFASRIL